MESSVGSAIEIIKRQEQTKEAKLKAHREFEALKTALERSIKEVTLQFKKLQEEEAELIQSCDKLRPELCVQKLRRDALVAQHEASTGDLNTLKTDLENTVTELQEMRSKYCTTVQEVADYCDVWALLMRPITEESLPRPLVKVEEVESEKIAMATKETAVHEERLRMAEQRREKAMAERSRLLAEPDVGEEFLSCRQYTYRSIRQFSNEAELKENEPIRFSTSSAATRKKKLVERTSIQRTPWYQPYSVVGSVSVFLIYFCCLREESDVDLEFSKTLYDRIESLEKHQLLQAYRYNKEHGKSVEEIEQRLKELEQMEKEATLAS